MAGGADFKPGQNDTTAANKLSFRPSKARTLELRQHNDYLYIATNRSGTLYTGMTNDLVRRMSEHRAGEIEGFTKKYNITRLVYFEQTTDVNAAIAREKQIKGWRRNKKIKLIEKMNPSWRDLFDEINAE